MLIRFRVRGVTKASRVGILCSAVGENLGLSLTRENPPRLKSYEICNIRVRAGGPLKNLDFEERVSAGVDRDRFRVPCFLSSDRKQSFENGAEFWLKATFWQGLMGGEL